MKILGLTAVLLALAAQTLEAQRASGVVLAQARVVPAFVASLPVNGSAVPAGMRVGRVAGVAASVPPLISVRSTDARGSGEHGQPRDVVCTGAPPAVRTSAPQLPCGSAAPPKRERTLTISVAVN